MKAGVKKEEGEDEGVGVGGGRKGSSEIWAAWGRVSRGQGAGAMKEEGAREQKKKREEKKVRWGTGGAQQQTFWRSCSKKLSEGQAVSPSLRVGARGRESNMGGITSQRAPRIQFCARLAKEALMQPRWPYRPACPLPLSTSSRTSAVHQIYGQKPSHAFYHALCAFLPHSFVAPTAASCQT